MNTPGDRLFCSKPFTWFEVSRGAREGEVFACCPAWLSRPLGNLVDQSVAQIWNGEEAQEIRASILDGSFRYCSRERCPHLKTVTAPVQRVGDVTDPRLQAAIRDQLTVLPYGPREINCSYDRSCNLSCPSCRTAVIVETARRDEIEVIRRKINEEALTEAELLYITGSGDPFGSPFFRKWLTTMRRADMPRLEIIHLHTNGLLWTPRFWEAIPEEIRALVKYADISIDAATAPTYALNRRGGDFEVLRANLEFIGSLRRNGPLTWLGIGMVVQENNYLEMPAFVGLGQGIGADTVLFSQLVNWGTYDETEYAERAIHRPEHRKHRDFVGLLANGVFADPIVYLGNLSDVSVPPPR